MTSNRKSCLWLVAVAAVLATAGVLFLRAANSWFDAGAAKVAAEATRNDDFRRVGGQGMMDFVLVSADLAQDEARFKATARTYCDKKRGRGKFCHLIFWVDPAMVATSLPMTEDQAEAMLGTYNRNPSTGNDKFSF